MLFNVPAMIDSSAACIIMHFSNNHQHTEWIELDSDSFDVLWELEYMLFRYKEGKKLKDPHDDDDWITLCLDGTGCVYPTESQQTAADILVSIFDTYSLGNNIALRDYQIFTVDHQGSQMPFVIERT